LGLVFLMMIVLFNLMLYLIVVKRVTRLSKIADEVSLGNMEAGEFRSRSKDEIGVLTDALGRMKTSVVQAMNMLEGKYPRGRNPKPPAITGSAAHRAS